ncbi:MAG: Ig-like domain-containing protein [Lachnospiraceae bacterium]|nr:Ig-like domain-containing protein [Lachnospiraceae bacterium]
MVKKSGYKPGVLSDDAFKFVTAYINYHRKAAGVGDITLNNDANVSASWGALVMAMNDKLDHYPDKPDGMSQEDFKKGEAATGSSNISRRVWADSGKDILNSSISGQMADSSSGNISRLGHRRWLINPDALTMGVGSANNSSNCYTDVKVLGDYITFDPVDDYEFIAWPASGNNLSDTFATDVPWSITLNEDRYSEPSRDAVAVTLKSVKTGKTWTFNKNTSTSGESGKNFFTVNNGGYAVSNCIIFRPGSLGQDAYKGEYTVSVTGLKDKSGNAKSLNYRVIFSSVKAIEAGDDLTVKGLTLSPKTMKLFAGQESDLNFVFTPKDAVPKDIKVETSPEGIVSVSTDPVYGKAKVKALKTGTTTVTVTVDGFTDTCDVTVKDSILLEYCNGTASYKWQKVTYGQPMTFLTGLELEYPGHELIGWYTAPDGKGTRVNADTRVGDYFSLYAYWREVVSEEIELSVYVDDYACVYTGKKVKPAVRVFMGEKQLKKGSDYKIKWKNNVNAYTLKDSDEGFDASKAPVAIVTGKGMYKGTYRKYFTIMPAGIGTIGIEDMWAACNGIIQKPVPVIKYNGKKLKKGRDFEPTYPSPNKGEAVAYRDPGDYDIMITAIEGGNYTGSKRTKFYMYNKKDTIDLSKAKVKKIAPIPYREGGVDLTAEELKVSAKVAGKYKDLIRGVDYEVQYMNKSNERAGTATAYIRPILWKSYNSKKIKFTITGVSIKRATIAGVTNKEYNGSELKQTPVLSIGGTVLDNVKDYTLSYKKNVNAGKAYMIVTGKGGYKDKVKVPFKILPGKIGRAKFIVADTTYANGDALEAGNVTVPYMKGGSTPTVIITDLAGTILKSGKDYTAKYKHNDKTGDKVATLTIKGKGNFSGEVQVGFSITKKKLEDMVIVIPDKVASKKKGAYIAKPVIYDDNGKKLKEGKDYRIKSYTAIYPDLSTAQLSKKSAVNTVDTVISVLLEGKGAYSENGSRVNAEAVADYLIKSKNFAGVTFPKITKPYSGNPVYLKENDFKKDGVSLVTIKEGKAKLPLEYGKDFEIVEGTYKSNVKAGTAKVTVRGLGEYAGIQTLKFKVGRRSILSLLGF